MLVRLFQNRMYTIDDVTFHLPLRLEADAGRPLQGPPNSTPTDIEYKTGTVWPNFCF